MSSHRFDWHEHITTVLNEYKLARLAVDRLTAAIATMPDVLPPVVDARKHLRNADKNLEGTYLVRLFAAFEAALRSYDRAKHHDPGRTIDASTLIDTIGGKHGRGIEPIVRERAHQVRRVRNYWAHESDQDPGPLTIDEARSRLQLYLRELPDEW